MGTKDEVDWEKSMFFGVQMIFLIHPQPSDNNLFSIQDDCVSHLGFGKLTSYFKPFFV